MTRPPVTLTCPKCGRTVTLHIFALASCTRCHRVMTPQRPRKRTRA